MKTVERFALVNHSAAQMYALVEDIEAYPQFLPWCSATEVVRRDDAVTVATIHADYHGLRQHFTTENFKRAGESITMRLLRGPFKQLEGKWHFYSLDERACKVELRLSYEFSGVLIERLAGPMFHHIGNSFVDAFVQRAAGVYPNVALDGS